MKITYSKHIKTRLALRKIEYNLPGKVFETAEELFHDTETGHNIAVRRAKLYDKERDIMVAYKQEDDDIRLLTIHLLKDCQKANRIQSGRWRKIK